MHSLQTMEVFALKIEEKNIIQMFVHKHIFLQINSERIK